MISVNMRMSETQKLQIEDAAKAVNMNLSAYMRAALYDAVKRSNAQAAKDPKSAADHLKLLDAKAKL